MAYTKGEINDFIKVITGVLGDLTTTDKSNLVAAINEVNAKGFDIKGEYANNTDAIAAGLENGDVYYNPIAGDVYNLSVVQDSPYPILLLDVDNPSETGFDYSTS